MNFLQPFYVKLRNNTYLSEGGFKLHFLKENTENYLESLPVSPPS
jgi:hypothetical protein